MLHYGTWPAGTEILLCSVPWDNNYTNIVNWRGTHGRKAYFDSFSKKLVVSKVTYCVPNRPVRLNATYSEVFGYNYMVVRNASQVEGATTYYYFINDVSYVAPNTTEVTLQLDVWTTYYPKVKFNRAYVTRGHVARWLDEKYGTVDHREWLCRPEGLDTGTDYLIGSRVTVKLANTSNIKVVICSTVNLSAQYGTETDPKLKAATGSNAEGLPNGCEIYVCTKDQYKSVVAYLKDYPWIAQGIISVTAVPDSMISSNGQGTTHLDGGKGPEVGVLIGTAHPQFTHYSDFRLAILSALPERYRPLKKFATSPFSYCEVTTYSGTPLHIAPEMVSSRDFTVSAWPHVVPPSPRIMFTVNNLMQHGSYSDGDDTHSAHFDVATGITALPSFSVTNNAALGALASQAHSIAYARESAAWQQSKALQSANWSRDVAGAGMAASGRQVNLANSTAAQQLGIQMGAQNATFRNNTLFGMGTAIAGGAASGGLPGAATAAIGSGVSAMQGRMNLDISQQAAADSLGVSQTAAIAANQISTELGTYVADGNLEMARNFAMGDYANTIAGINAKIQDTQLTPPSVSGQVGGDALNLALDNWRIDVRLKIPHMGVIRSIGEYWFRYGYALGEYINLPENLMCMTHMTYWKCVDVNITGDVPQPIINIMRGMLERGVTVWASPSDIGILDPATNNVDGSAKIGY